MFGRAVIVAAGTLLLSGAASAQTSSQNSDKPTDAAQAQSKRVAKTDPVPAEPDPLTPPEVQSGPIAAPAAIDPVKPEPAATATPAVTPAATTPATPPAPPAAEPALPVVDPVLQAVRQRLETVRGRESAADAADRAALVAHYEAATAGATWTTPTGFTPRAEAAMAEIRKADDWGLKASAFDLPFLPAGPVSAEARADAEIKLGLATLKYARHARGGRLEPSSVSKLFDRKAQIYEPRSLIRSITASADPAAYLRNLHPKHAGFRNLQKALVALRSGEATQPPAAAPEPEAVDEGKRGKGKGKAVRKTAPATTSETIRRVVANMERWRWMPDNLGAFHVWNNVPEQMTTVFKDGKPVFQERIVVGKPDTATPNFSADMQFVIFQPEWGVPGGIKSNEIGPMLRRASAESGGWFGGSSRTPSSVLARHGLRVSVGGQVVNPDSINWSSVDINRFNFIQPAGPTNVLGVVKFRFPNKHDVYMHDTPQKHLFSSSVRAFSHGCMRVQNPVRFAEVLLEHDKGWASDRVRGMVPRGGEVKLTTQIPVHNVYFTAIADENGKLRTYGDLYGTDGRVASALEGRAVAVASRGEAASSEPAAPRAKSERTAKKQRGQNTASNEGFNPFAGLFGN